MELQESWENCAFFLPCPTLRHQYPAVLKSSWLLGCQGSHLCKQPPHSCGSMKPQPKNDLNDESDDDFDGWYSASIWLRIWQNSSSLKTLRSDTFKTTIPGIFLFIAQNNPDINPISFFSSFLKQRSTGKNLRWRFIDSKNLHQDPLNGPLNLRIE